MSYVIFIYSLIQLLKNKVSVFGAYLHGHLAATQVIARQFRDGKELKIIDEDKRYDFNYQQYKILEKPIEFLPVCILILYHSFLWWHFTSLAPCSPQ